MACTLYGTCPKCFKKFGPVYRIKFLCDECEKKEDKMSNKQTTEFLAEDFQHVAKLIRNEQSDNQLRAVLSNNLNIILAALDAVHERDELLSWKAQAMQVMNDLDLQEVGKQMGLKLGDNIAINILPYIKQLKDNKS